MDVPSARQATQRAHSRPDRRRSRAGDRAARSVGVPRAAGESLIKEWLRSTEMLPDFRSAPDFSTVADDFALDAYRRERRPAS